MSDDKPLLECPKHGSVPWDEVRYNPHSSEPYHWMPRTPIGRIACGADLFSSCTCAWKNARERAIIDPACPAHGHSELQPGRTSAQPVREDEDRNEVETRAHRRIRMAVEAAGGEVEWMEWEPVGQMVEKQGRSGGWQVFLKGGGHVGGFSVDDVVAQIERSAGCTCTEAEERSRFYRWSCPVHGLDAPPVRGDENDG